MGYRPFPRVCEVLIDAACNNPTGEILPADDNFGPSRWSAVFNAFAKQWGRCGSSELFYSKAIPCGVRRGNSREHEDVFKVSIANNTNCSVGDIKVQLQSETDPLLAYQCAITARSYDQLRREQNLRIDFCAFPRKVVDLFENALNPQEDQRLRAHLEISNDDKALVVLVQSTEFRELAHLSLQLEKVANGALESDLVEQISLWSNFGESLLSYAIGAIRALKSQLLASQSEATHLELLLKQATDSAAEAAQSHKQRVASIMTACSEETEALKLTISEATSSRKLHDQQFAEETRRRESELEECRREIERLRGFQAKSEALSSELVTSRQQADLSAKELAETQGTLDILGKQLREAEPLIAGAVEKEKLIETLKSKVSELVEDAGKAKSTIHHLNLRGRAIKNQCRELQTQNAEIHQQVLDTKNLHAAASNELARARGEAEGLQGELASSKACVKRLQDDIAELEATVNAKNQLLDYLNHQANDREVAELQSGGMLGRASVPSPQISWFTRPSTSGTGPIRSLSPGAIAAIKQTFPDRPLPGGGRLSLPTASGPALTVPVASSSSSSSAGNENVHPASCRRRDEAENVVRRPNTVETLFPHVRHTPSEGGAGTDSSSRHTTTDLRIAKAVIDTDSNLLFSFFPQPERRS